MAIEVKAGETWQIALGADGQWRAVQILAIKGDQVDVQYLDMGTAPDSMRRLTLSRRQMLENPKRYRAPDTY